ncbi:MAG: hypothetical protein JWN93_3759, partial [Hyphomicrobiales bacterium]|nr:hypothetical protein [Hyphomicrobiales bacterium]
MSELFEISGFAFASYTNNPGSTEAIAELAASGANSISIVPTWYVSNAAASDFTAGATMGTDAELLKSIADAQAQ